MQTNSATHRIQSITIVYAQVDIPHPKLRLGLLSVWLDLGFDPMVVPILVSLDSRSAVVQLTRGGPLQDARSVGSLYSSVLTTALACRLHTTAADEITS